MEELIQKYYHKIEKAEEAEPFRANCESTYYRKIKYAQNHQQMMKFSSKFSMSLRNYFGYQMWLEINIQQDPTKTISQRSSTQILDFLGDIGGFKEAFMLIIYMVAEYFSAKFLSAYIAENYYSAKERG